MIFLVKDKPSLATTSLKGVEVLVVILRSNRGHTGCSWFRDAEMTRRRNSGRPSFRRWLLSES